MIMNPSAIENVVLDGHSLNLESFVAVARYNSTVELAGSALEAMKKSRALAEKIAEEGRVAYGITTGFGDLLGQGPGLLHGLQGGAGQLHRGVVPGDGDKALQVQAMAVQDDLLDGGRIHNHGELPHFSLFFRHKYRAEN